MTSSLYSYGDYEERIPAGHPLRKIRAVVNDALSSLESEFDRLCAVEGRSSIALERLIRASLLQILYSVRSMRQLHGADGLQPAVPLVRGPRDRGCCLCPNRIQQELRPVADQGYVPPDHGRHPRASRGAPLLSEDHFSADGTLVKAWGSMKNFQPKEGATSGGADDPRDPPDTSVPLTSSSDQSTAEPDPMDHPTRRNRNAEVDLLDKRRSNATHASITDPEARLLRKFPGAGAMLCLMGHSMMENRSGLIVQADLTRADGNAERRAAIDMIHRHSPVSTRRMAMAADCGYNSADFVAELRQMLVTPHVAQKSRHSAIDDRTTQHPGYAKSQRRWKKFEEPCGWVKTVGGMAQTLYRGVGRVRARLTLAIAASNLVSIPRPLAA